VSRHCHEQARAAIRRRLHPVILAAIRQADQEDLALVGVVMAPEIIKLDAQARPAPPEVAESPRGSASD